MHPSAGLAPSHTSHMSLSVTSGSAAGFPEDVTVALRSPALTIFHHSLSTEHTSSSVSMLNMQAWAVMNCRQVWGEEQAVAPPLL